MSADREQQDARSNERGSIIVMTAISALALLMVVGLTIDVSRIYVVRAELQNAADAAALTAARELDGGTGGIDQAVNQATNVIANNRGFKTKAGVTIASVEFAQTLNGSYMNATAAKTVAANIKFVKVTTESTSTAILFASHALGLSHAESREAVAGMSVDLGGVCDFFPAAVGLTIPNPPPGTNMTLKFAQGTGTTAIVNNFDYIVLEVPCITGNGEVETARLAAGEPCGCNNLGGNINMTPSSNFGNGGRAAGDGMNTRFGTYVGGYGGYLTPSNYASDTNVTEGITYTNYVNNIPRAGNNRRLIVAPIVQPRSYPANTNGQIIGWGKFFLKTKMYVSFSGNCANNLPCGFMSVEYVGRANVNATGPVSCSSGLTTSVLYR
jgi:Flp pilus assembly protein TadG